MDTYLIKYLRDIAETELSSKYIDFFKIELDWHIYNSEQHIAELYHRNHSKGLKIKLIHGIQYSIALIEQSKRKTTNSSNILSTVSFSDPNILNDLGFNLFSPVWNAVGKKNIFGDLKTIKWHNNIQDLIHRKDFCLYLDSKMHQDLEDFQDYFISQYSKQNFKALLLYTDQYFYSKYFIDIFKKIDRPSFVFSHGLPGIYSLEVDNRSDYLMVWSEKIKQNYINTGFNPYKIKVVGNPKYKKIDQNKELKSDLSDVLIIPVSSAIWHQHEYESTIITDKSMVVLYLYKVQSVLRKLGIRRARYRPHPSINIKWLHAFLDQEFYFIDNQTLDESIKRSSLLIGATSTVMLESLINGVNYIVFEPKDEHNINMAGFKLVPPFDDSEEKLMVATDENELEKMLQFNARTDYTLVHDYIQDFDLSVLKELIK